jgi:phage-related protein
LIGYFAIDTDRIAFNVGSGGSDPVGNLYYALATPTDTEITNEALIAQLDALLNTARTYAGINNIFTITPNEQGTLEITYYTERDSDKRDELIIDSRMRTVTLNGTDVYHLIAAGSEFPMLAPGENKLMLRSDIPGDNGYAEVNYKQGYLSI